MRRASPEKPAWRINHYLDPSEAIKFLSEKREELAAFCELYAHAPKFAADHSELSRWIEHINKLCTEMCKTAATVESLAEQDDYVLMVLNPRARQSLKAELALTAAQLERAQALRDQLLKRD